MKSHWAIMAVKKQLIFLYLSMELLAISISKLSYQ